MLYSSVALLPSPSSNIEAWQYIYIARCVNSWCEMSRLWMLLHPVSRLFVIVQHGHSEFIQIAKICRLNVKCGSCNQSHRTSDCNQLENLECANCEKPHKFELRILPSVHINPKEIYGSRNNVLPQNLQLKIIDAKME